MVKLHTVKVSVTMVIVIISFMVYLTCTSSGVHTVKVYNMVIVIISLW